MKMRFVASAAAIVFTLATSTPTAGAQQTSPQSPGTGATQAGSGRGVPTDPKTQGTTDRAGQTPRVPTGAEGQPAGSLGGDRGATERRGDTAGGETATTATATTEKAKSGSDSKAKDRKASSPRKNKRAGGSGRVNSTPNR
jgi:hypothetical protein